MKNATFQIVRIFPAGGSLYRPFKLLKACKPESVAFGVVDGVSSSLGDWSKWWPWTQEPPPPPE